MRGFPFLFHSSVPFPSLRAHRRRAWQSLPYIWGCFVATLLAMTICNPFVIASGKSSFGLLLHGVPGLLQVLRLRTPCMNPKLGLPSHWEGSGRGPFFLKAREKIQVHLPGYSSKLNVSSTLFFLTDTRRLWSPLPFRCRRQFPLWWRKGMSR